MLSRTRSHSICNKVNTANSYQNIISRTLCNTAKNERRNNNNQIITTNLLNLEAPVAMGLKKLKTKVKQKMLYAATRATLKSEFGDNRITQELHAAAKTDVSWESYERFLKRREEPGPMTHAERELRAIRLIENDMKNELVIKPRRALVDGVLFPLDSDAKYALLQIRSGLCNYVQLSIDIPSEVIRHECSGNFSTADVQTNIPKDRPAYHIYLYRHTYQHQPMTLFVFLYSVPDQRCTIKERMLHSTCVAPLLNSLASDYGIKISKRMEIESGRDVSDSRIIEALHPSTHEANFTHRVAIVYDKVKGPLVRGPKRLLKL